MIRTVLLLVFFLCCFCPSAFATPYRAPVSAVAGEADLIPAGITHSRRILPFGMSPRLRFQLFVPGVGRLRFKFDKERALDVLPVTLTENLTVSDGGKITLLKGRVSGHGFESRVAGSVQWQNGEPIVTAAFRGPGARQRRILFYRITIPLKNPRRARVQRGSGLQQQHCSAAETRSGEVELLSTAPDTSELVSTATRELEINIDAERSWALRFGASSNTKISQFLNEVEETYDSQFAIRFKVVRQVVHTDRTFGDADALNKLEAYRQFTAGNVSADVSHLFTATDLIGGTIGVAYIGSVCTQNFNVGVDQFTSDTVFPVTFAHELGHNFGASHTDGGIMNAFATGKGLSQVTFNSRSTQEINFFLSQIQCLKSVTGTKKPPPDGTAVKLSLASNVNRSGGFSLSLSAARPLQNCKLDFLQSQNSSRIESGKIWLERSFAGTTFTSGGSITSRAKRKNRRGVLLNYNIAARLSCDDGSRGLSNIVTLKPERIKTAGGNRLGRKKWFSELARSIAN